MVKKTMAAVFSTVLLLAAAARGEAAGVEVAAATDDAKEHHFTSGLRLSTSASSERTLFGPGLSWGLVLVPEGLELEATVRSQVGGRFLSVPIDLAFRIPFRVGDWLRPFVQVGPMLLIEQDRERTWHDFAAAAAAGVALDMPGHDWRLVVSGDYQLRLWQEIRNQGGFTAGFQYRF